MLSDNRISKDEYYLNIAKAVSMRGTCLRRCYGAVIVKNDKIISTGYAGAPKGYRNCNQIGTCVRKELNIPPGERYELCRSVHAEANAIIQASANDLEGSTLYLFGRNADSEEALPFSECCAMCQRMIINSGIKYVKSYRDNKVDIINVEKWIYEDNHIENDE